MDKIDNDTLETKLTEELQSVVASENDNKYYVFLLKVFLLILGERADHLPIEIVQLCMDTLTALSVYKPKSHDVGDILNKLYVNIRTRLGKILLKAISIEVIINPNNSSIGGYEVEEYLSIINEDPFSRLYFKWKEGSIKQVPQDPMIVIFKLFETGKVTEALGLSRKALETQDLIKDERWVLLKLTEATCLYFLQEPDKLNQALTEIPKKTDIVLRISCISRKAMSLHFNSTEQDKALTLLTAAMQIKNIDEALRMMLVAVKMEILSSAPEEKENETYLLGSTVCKNKTLEEGGTAWTQGASLTTIADLMMGKEDRNGCGRFTENELKMTNFQMKLVETNDLTLPELVQLSNCLAICKRTKELRKVQAVLTSMQIGDEMTERCTLWIALQKLTAYPESVMEDELEKVEHLAKSATYVDVKAAAQLALTINYSENGASRPALLAGFCQSLETAWFSPTIRMKILTYALQRMCSPLFTKLLFSNT